VLVDPMEPTLKAPGSKRLKLERKKMLSNFVFDSNLRRYNQVYNASSLRTECLAQLDQVAKVQSSKAGSSAGGPHSSTFQANLSRI
jgi:hypothetical protein